VTSNPGYRGAEFLDGVDDTPAVRTHHGGLAEPVGLDRPAVWDRQGAGSLVRGAARGGESKEREARLLGAGALAPVAGLTEIGRIPASCQTARPAHRSDSAVGHQSQRPEAGSLCVAPRRCRCPGSPSQ
jgi:hypothetical protein